MKVGILGFAGSGKTTVFNLLTGLSASVGPGGDRKPNMGVIKVPDVRIDDLTRRYKPKKTTYAEVRFVDIAGSSDRDKGGLDAALLTHIRDTEALTLVVRAFESPLLDAAANPGHELRELESELLLGDFAVAEKRLERVRKEGKGKDREALLLERCLAQLEAQRPLRELSFTEEEELCLRGFRFLSQKPALVLINTSDSAPTAVAPEVTGYAKEHGLTVLALCASVEAEVAELEPEDRLAFLAEYGITAPARDRFVQAAYALLDLISMFTSGEDEVRAWTVQRGTPAQKAAGKIHSDIEKGFIRAEVTAYADLVHYGDEQKVKAAGKLRLEGKEYIVQDGDICHFRHAS